MRTVKIKVAEPKEDAAAIAAIKELFEPEELDPELKACIVDIRGTRFIKHPLVVVLYAEALNRQLNRSFKIKRTEADKARKKKDWQAFVFWHERPFRLDALMSIAFEATPKTDRQHERMANLVLSVWADSEYPGVNRDVWLFLLRRYVNGSRLQAKAQKKVPSVLYRGTASDELKVSRLGISWTASKEVAEWFAKRSAQQKGRKVCRVYSAEVTPDCVLARYDGRNEAEWILDPRMTVTHCKIFAAKITLKGD